MNAAHDAVVLAAGGSRRLGQPKQLLMRDGEPLVRRVARLAAATLPRRMVVVTGAHREAVMHAVRGLDCDCIHNPDWERGLASSLQIAAEALSDRDNSVLVLGCDQPALEAAHLGSLLSGARNATSGCAATMHTGGAGIPAVVPGAWLQGLPPVGDRGLGLRLRALPIASLSLLQAPELEFDLDTAADVEQARLRGLLDLQR